MFQRQRQRRSGITTRTLKDWYVTTYYDMTPQLETMTEKIVETRLYEAMKKIALERIEEEKAAVEPRAPVLAETQALLAKTPAPPSPVLAEPMES